MIGNRRQKGWGPGSTPLSKRSFKGGRKNEVGWRLSSILPPTGELGGGRNRQKQMRKEDGECHDQVVLPHLLAVNKRNEQPATYYLLKDKRDLPARGDVTEQIVPRGKKDWKLATSFLGWDIGAQNQSKKRKRKVQSGSGGA